jgi:hypothetical protein
MVYMMTALLFFALSVCGEYATRDHIVLVYEGTPFNSQLNHRIYGLKDNEGVK